MTISLMAKLVINISNLRQTAVDKHTSNQE